MFWISYNADGSRLFAALGYGVARLIALAAVASLATLAACGGITDDAATAPKNPSVTAAEFALSLDPTAPGASTAPQDGNPGLLVRHIDLKSGASELKTGASANSTTLTATAYDLNFKPVVGAKISFHAEGAQIVVINAVTDADGHAFAKISAAGDRRNRTVTASATGDSEGAVPMAITIPVTGTHVRPPLNLEINSHSRTVIRAQIVDSDDVGVPDVDVEAKAARGDLVTLVSKITDANGEFVLTIDDVVGGEEIIDIIYGGLHEQLVTKPRFMAPDSWQASFDTGTHEIVTGYGSNSTNLTLTVTDGDNKPLINAPVEFKVDTGVIVAPMSNTNSSGQAMVTVSTGEDLSNRVMTVEASVGKSQVPQARTAIKVSGTTLTLQVAPVLTVLNPEPWQFTLRDGAGKPIKKAAIQVSGTVSQDATGNPYFPIQLASFAQLPGVTDQSVMTDENGIGKLELGTPAAEMARKSLWVTGTYGRGLQTARDHQHVYEGSAVEDAEKVFVSSNLLTESYQYQYLAKDWHRLLLTLPEDTIYETPNAKGPTTRSADCGDGISKITVSTGNQQIVLRGRKTSTRTCVINWGADYFGKSEYINGGENFGYYKVSGMETTGVSASDFRIWYDPSDNASLPAGTYIAPVRFAVSHSNPYTRKDDFWGYRDIVVYIRKR